MNKGSAQTRIGESVIGVCIVTHYIIFGGYAEPVEAVVDIVEITDDLVGLEDLAVVETRHSQGFDIGLHHLAGLQGEFFGVAQQRQLAAVKCVFRPLRAQCLFDAVGPAIVVDQVPGGVRAICSASSKSASASSSAIIFSRRSCFRRLGHGFRAGFRVPDRSMQCEIVQSPMR